MQWISHAAPASSCLSANGVLRSIAKAVAVGACVPDRNVAEACARNRACTRARSAKCMRVGTWRDPAVHRTACRSSRDAPRVLLCGRISSGTTAAAPFFTTTRTTMPGFLASGALKARRCSLSFHALRCELAVAPASVVVFDPFEVHGVLAPGCARMPQTTIRVPKRASSSDLNSTSTPTTLPTLSISKRARAGT